MASVMKKMNLQPNSIKCQTVISKNLGPLKEWRRRLTLTKEAGYNVIHFTPIQELGASRSAYSLRNQHKVNPLFKASLDDVKKEVDFMEKRWGVFSLTDIVLNHTADDSPWIREHPECSFNTYNTPSLRPAFLLDSAFLWAQGDLSMSNTLPLSEADIQTIGIQLKTFYVPKLKIWELFMIDVQSAKSYDQYLVGDELIVDYGDYERYGAKIKCIPKSIQSQAEFINCIQVVNSKKKVEICAWLHSAVDNALSAMRYERLNPRGPYYNQGVCETRPLVAPYFSHTKDFKIAREEELMYSGYDRFMAHNGWVMGCADAQMENTYLKRELVAWGDCIKLRYGSGPNDVPYLWTHMKKYVESQAKIFHGFRIDNCHSTPLHVAKYFLDLARKQRPDLYVMAELFTSSEEVDNLYVSTLAINSLIRESMMVCDARELGRLMHRFGGTPVGAFFQHGPPPPPVAHAIFFDQTHDNESAITRRSAYDVAPTAAIINMANCAAGSTRGYDELVPHQIDVVTEERPYALDADINSGILPVRRFLNGPLKDLLAHGFNETFVDQVNDDVIAMTRHNPNDGRSIVLIARTAFSKEQETSYIRPIQIEGHISTVLFESQSTGDPHKYERDQSFINGLSDFRAVVLSEQIAPGESKLSKIVQEAEGKAEIQLDDTRFRPSSILAVEVRLTNQQSQALRELNQWNLNSATLDLNLIDVNYILFRCAGEEGCEPYEIPGFTKFTYCGLYGLMFYLEKVRENQDQAHPLVMNLRQGRWLSDYIVNRLRKRASTEQLASNLESALSQVYLLPKSMIPKYFDVVITRTYNALLELVYSSMSPFVSKGSEEVKMLALSSVALVGEPAPSLAAGLPHFSSGYMREWGRDTFISLRGLMLLTGRFKEAEHIILAYGRTLKHGLIPNLFDGGVNPRYNCRDAVWWWLYAVREYTKLAPNGNHIIDLLSDTIQKALQSHFSGIEFVDNGQDDHMTQGGRTVICGVDRKTGFVFGGNEFNCGTWMDKMGSSTVTGNKGRPASSRDGAAIEIIGLSKAVLTWLDELSRNHVYPHTGVESLYDNTITIPWSWKKWASLIQSNFEAHFYIPVEEVSNDPHPELINLRGIYKDTLGANPPWQDYQFRPNFLVAMVVAPELFNKTHAKHALNLAKERLCGPMGMKTLDPSDWKYKGDYDNGDESNGYNYHQGPEWIWLTGYYIRACSKFLGDKPSMKFESMLKSTPWLGLPELTNSNGKFCKDSCPIQAWSVATVLEALYE